MISIFRLVTTRFPQVRIIISADQRYICTSPVSFAEPLKKKKKLDPQIIKQREDRKKRKLEKQIRRLEKNARQLKPIEELEVPLDLIDEKQKRARVVLQAIQNCVEERSDLLKKWGCHKLDQKTSEFQTIDRLLAAQKKALMQLKEESEDLHREAVRPVLVPLKLQGPVATPPLQNYKSPDGEYLDVTRKWE